MCIRDRLYENAAGINLSNSKVRFLGRTMELGVSGDMLGPVSYTHLGLGIKGYLCLKDHKVMDFFCDVVLWFMLLVGLILMLLPSDIFASIAQTTIEMCIRDRL